MKKGKIKFYFWLLLIAAAVYWWVKPDFSVNERSVRLLETNYGSEIERVCKKEGLPAEYFKALVILECSAKKPAGNRFEPHVFNRLLAVKSGKQQAYGKLTQKDLKKYSESTLKQFATSWGPLQIMGYHCLSLGVGIDALKGKESLKYGIKWCGKEYGKYLQEQDFKNAFHYHNTGRAYPNFGFSQTHDPDYVDKGIAYLAAFRFQRNDYGLPVER